MFSFCFKLVWDIPNTQKTMFRVLTSELRPHLEHIRGLREEPKTSFAVSTNEGKRWSVVKPMVCQLSPWFIPTRQVIQATNGAKFPPTKPHQRTVDRQMIRWLKNRSFKPPKNCTMVSRYFKCFFLQIGVCIQSFYRSFNMLLSLFCRKVVQNKNAKGSLDLLLK